VGGSVAVKKSGVCVACSSLEESGLQPFDEMIRMAINSRAV
jgi:hypothetical protein